MLYTNNGWIIEEVLHIVAMACYYPYKNGLTFHGSHWVALRR